MYVCIFDNFLYISFYQLQLSAFLWTQSNTYLMPNKVFIIGIIFYFRKQAVEIQQR